MKTVEELYLAGQRLEQFHNPHFDPEAYYREALRRDPGDARTNTAVGLLALRRGRFDDAEKRLAAAVARLTANHTRARSGEAQYALGLALVALGRPEAAREALAAAGWDRAFTAAAALEQARLESARETPPARSSCSIAPATRTRARRRRWSCRPPCCATAGGRRTPSPGRPRRSPWTRSTRSRPGSAGWRVRPEPARPPTRRPTRPRPPP